MLPTCGNCGRSGHEDNHHPACPFYNRDREDHDDAAMGDTIPHMSQTNIALQLDGMPLTQGLQRSEQWYEGHKVEITVDGKNFGLGTASGKGCNCLIDTLRQQLNEMGEGLEFFIPESSVNKVRS